MKYHELEAMIDAIKKTKSETNNILPTKTPIKPGHYPPRPIPVEGVEDDGVVIKTPKAPPARKVKPTKAEKAEPPTIKITFDEEDEDVKVVTVDKPVKAVKAVKKPVEEPVEPASLASPLPRTKSEKKTVHFCNCPNCKL
jgi:hypothetical protein